MPERLNRNSKTCWCLPGLRESLQSVAGDEAGMQSVRVVHRSLPVFVFEYCIEIATNNDVFPSSRGIL
ncbi:hypothetical protein CHLRE_17g734725v5 [Chlamydomonas reinhardtii]|uniref:Uncharacterized protein n=1 Tax=Chlamydomonas reinhardtii TaxID=3055 RepID=A0A2K3CRB2_CHLRE|nr:uncharacterized protein CHLRE_17g734725v5 [Chlamydomonas reinhardtii]PNW70814.1 hypothetical protein CHLRE_17g734725v5 [Chlamydomonas reinhardtii]